MIVMVELRSRAGDLLQPAVECPAIPHAGNRLQFGEHTFKLLDSPATWKYDGIIERQDDEPDDVQWTIVLPAEEVKPTDPAEETQTEPRQRPEEDVKKKSNEIATPPPLSKSPEIPSGARFGRLEVIGRTESTTTTHAMYSCKCVCGKQVTKRGEALRSGRTSSCGCAYPSGNARPRRPRLKPGDIFGRLTVVGDAPRVKGNSDRRVECLCQCGKTHTTCVGSLRSGATRSCGCLQMEMRVKTGKANRRRPVERELPEKIDTLVFQSLPAGVNIVTPEPIEDADYLG